MLVRIVFLQVLPQKLLTNYHSFAVFWSLPDHLVCRPPYPVYAIFEWFLRYIAPEKEKKDEKLCSSFPLFNSTCIFFNDIFLCVRVFKWMIILLNMCLVRSDLHLCFFENIKSEEQLWLTSILILVGFEKLFLIKL